MGQLQKSAATLGFYGDDLDPDEITALLGVTPTVGVAKGGSWLTSLGGEKVAHTGSWRIEANPCEPEDLNGWLTLTRRFRGVIFCGLWLKTHNEGLELRADVLGLLAERGLLLDFDIYATNERD